MSEFWQRKMRTFVRRHDFNNDGVLTKEDFELLGNHFAELEQADSDRRKTVRSKFFELFKVFSKLVPEGDSLTEANFIEAIKAQRDDPAFVKSIKDTAYAVFTVNDSNGDGYLQKDEYTRQLKCINVEDYDTMSMIAFNGMDTNQDGLISNEEYQAAIVDFFCGENEKGNGTLVFGPLI